MKTPRNLFLCLLICCAFCVQAQTIFTTQPFVSQIKTLRVVEVGETDWERPVLALDDNRRLEISFDELSHDEHYYSYTVMHCNADWTLSDLQSTEYLQGFTTLDIQDYQQSLNTTQIYTHYRFEIPNDDMQLKLSGNYVVLIYEDGDKNNVVATACFSVVEPMADMDIRVRYNTLKDLNGRHQQLDINASFDQGSSQWATETKLVIKQNNRMDNRVYDVKPTYVSSNQLRYIDNHALVFEGGGEYRHFDLASLYLLGYNVNSINYDHNYYHVTLESDRFMEGTPYNGQEDVDGQFRINAERANDVDTEADYVWVHFFVPTDKPYLSGQMYVGGDFSYNLLSAENCMKYDNYLHGYTYSALLKQGGYNYQYWFFPKGREAATLLPTEGSHWQTQNEYSVYLYYRPFGQRYDRLIGYKTIKSRP